MRWRAAATVTTTIVQVAQLAVLARLLPPSDFGVFALVIVVVGFAQTLSDVGVGNAIIHRPRPTREQLSSLFWLNAAGGLAIALLAAAAAPFVAGFYSMPEVEVLLLWSAPVFVLTALGQQSRALMEKDFRFAYLAKVEVAAVTAGALASVLFALAGHGVLSLVWGQMLTAALRAVCFAARGWAELGLPQLRLRRSDLDGFLGFGLWQTGERIAGYFANNLDKVLIGKLLGPGPLGLYAVARDIVARPIQTLNPIVTKVAFPVFSRVQDDDARLRRGYLKVIRVIAFVTFPVYLGLFAVADLAIPLLLGPDWIPAVPVFRVLVLAGAFKSLSNPLTSLLLAKGQARLSFWLAVLSGLASALAIALGAGMGPVGIALGLLVVVLAVMHPVEMVVRRRLVGMDARGYLAEVVPFLVAGGLMAGVVLALGRVAAPVPPLARLALLGAAGAAVYLAAVHVQRRALLKEFMTLARA